MDRIQHRPTRTVPPFDWKRRDRRVLRKIATGNSLTSSHITAEEDDEAREQKRDARVTPGAQRANRRRA